MVFTVEDGTVVEDANAYITVAEYKAYHKDRGRVITDSGGQIQSYIIQATSYMESRYSSRYRGWRSQKDQELGFPRIDAYDDDEYLLDPIPKQLKYACAEFSYAASLVGVLAPNVPSPVPLQGIDGTVTAVTTPAGQITKFREKLDTLEEETHYNVPTVFPGKDALLPRFQQAEMYMRGLLKGGSGGDISRG